MTDQLFDISRIHIRMIRNQRYMVVRVSQAIEGSSSIASMAGRTIEAPPASPESGKFVIRRIRRNG